MNTSISLIYLCVMLSGSKIYTDTSCNHLHDWHINGAFERKLTIKVTKQDKNECKPVNEIQLANYYWLIRMAETERQLQRNHEKELENIKGFWATQYAKSLPR